MLQLQFWQIQAALGKRGNSRTSPGQAHAAFTASGLKSGIGRSLRCSSNRPSWFWLG